MNGSGTTGGSVTWNFDADVSKLLRALDSSNKKVDETEKKLKSLDDAGDRSLGNLAKVSDGLKGVLRPIGTLATRLSEDFVDLGRAVAAVGRQVVTVAGVAFKAISAGAAIAGGALVALGVAGVSSAKELQTLQISMNGLTKSMDLGAEAMAEAYKYAKSAPFQLTDVAATTKTLLAYGRQVKDVSTDLQTLGNVSITTGVPIDALGNIFGRVSAQGKLMGQDISQLTENGVAILPALQKQLGKTAEQVQEMASDGQISFEQFNKAMKSLVDPSILKQLENTLPRQIDRLRGSVRILSNAFVGVSVDAKNGFRAAGDSIYQQTVDITRIVADTLRGPGVLAAATEMGRSISIGLSEVIKWIDANRPKVDEFFGRFAGYLKTINDTAQQKGIGAGLAKVADDINRAFDSVDFRGIGKDVMKGLHDQFNNLNLVGTGKKILDAFFKTLEQTDLAPYTQTLVSTILSIFSSVDYAKLAAGAVGILIVAVPDIIDGFISGLIDVAVNQPLDLIQFLLAVGFLPAKWVKAISSVLGRIPFVGPLAEFMLNGIKSVTDKLLEPIRNMFKPLGKKITTGIKEGVSDLKQVLDDSVWSPIQGFFRSSGSWLFERGKGVIGGLTNGIRNAGSGLWNGIADVASNIGRFFGDAGSWLYSAGRNIIQGLIDGIGSMFGSVRGKLGDLTKKIGSWKGPPPVDARLLTDNGRLIIGSLIAGFESKYGDVKSSLQELTHSMWFDTNQSVQEIQASSGANNVVVQGGGNTSPAASAQPLVINFNPTGIVARSRTEWREIMKDGVAAIDEELRARRLPQILPRNTVGRSTAA